MSFPLKFNCFNPLPHPHPHHPYNNNININKEASPLPCESARFYVKPLLCLPVQQQVDSGITCESCGDRGWLICDFCKGQMTNVRGDNNRIYRRCPSCKAIGSILCSKCKVFRCVTFPNDSDGEKINF